MGEVQPRHPPIDHRRVGHPSAHESLAANLCHRVCRAHEMAWFQTAWCGIAVRMSAFAAHLCLFTAKPIGARTKSWRDLVLTSAASNAWAFHWPRE